MAGSKCLKHTHTQKHAKVIQIFCEQRLHKVNKLSDQEALEQVEEEIKSGGDGDREGQRYRFILVRWSTFHVCSYVYGT